jgi:hypothetical protein
MPRPTFRALPRRWSGRPRTARSLSALGIGLRGSVCHPEAPVSVQARSFCLRLQREPECNRQAAAACRHPPSTAAIFSTAGPETPSEGAETALLPAPFWVHHTRGTGPLRLALAGATRSGSAGVGSPVSRSAGKATPHPNGVKRPRRSSCRAAEVSIEDYVTRARLPYSKNGGSKSKKIHRKFLMLLGERGGARTRRASLDLAVRAAC